MGKSKKNNKIGKTRMAAVNNTAFEKMYKKSSKKKDSKLNNFLSKILVIIFGLIVAIILIFVSGAFDISEIIVEGNNYISKEQIISFSEIEMNTNIFSVSKKDVYQKIKENAYIDDVRIKKVFPNKIKLIVKERKKAYRVSIASGFIYIDNQGYVLEIANFSAELPILMGLSTDLTNVKPNSRLNNEDLKKMNMVIKIMDVANSNNFEKLITKIDISDSSNYTIYLDTVSKVAYLGNGYDLNTKMLYVKAIVKANEGKSGEIILNVDLNSENPYFRENV